MTTSVRIGIDFGLSVLTVALAACSGSVAPGLPTIVFTDPAPPSILEVPAAQMPEALKQFYVLKPDRRFLGAVAELHRLLSGDAADTVRVSRQGDRWVIAYAAERVGDLPDLPGFAEGSALLHSWAKRLLERYPLDTAGAPTGQERDTVAALLARLDASQLGAALRVVDAGWRRNRHAAWLPLAASGLVLLATQLPKVDVVGDPLVARALASVALAGAAGQAGTRSPGLGRCSLSTWATRGTRGGSRPGSRPAILCAFTSRATGRAFTSRPRAPGPRPSRAICTCVRSPIWATAMPSARPWTRWECERPAPAPWAPR